ncbi:sugar phosphate isomerase/epimerase family protein [Leifsonia sp. F6_8S_P_1B]|uniref:Sugar phosphate isomerase/epimerase family protein n=1 Tax=Leifsonia williamsii TaxID=3035919 RepID=A0ABT8KFU2_9MICO|nr:sugar phosphate isomerase/epimerase family protein [Leifsonia williamsii]MDN4616316.1 sugar phosphate isomerase/epimerase family protein [Leifsonia williamsii]
MRLGYCSITWGGVVGHPTGVTSVKDLFYLTHGDMQRAVEDIGAAGYEGVEMFDGNLVEFADRPEVLTGHLRDAGLELVSVYSGANFIYPDILPDELDRIRRSADLAAQFGAGRLVIGGGARRAAGTTDEDYGRLADSLNQVTDIAEAAGVEASYHPHLSTIVESPEELDRLLPATRIGFCPDVAHLAAGGGDPAAIIRAYGDRINHVHLKDLTRESVTFQPLGAGDLDLPGILAALRDTGYDGWLMVELDDYDGDPKDAARASRDSLRRLLAA